MSSPGSPTIAKVIGNIVEEVLKERAERSENQETAPTERVEEETEEEIEVEIEAREARAFYSDKGVEAFNKKLAKKGFVEERGFGEFMMPFKEEIERRGWEAMCKHMELGRRALVKEFYANLGDRKT